MLENVVKLKFLAVVGISLGNWCDLLNGNDVLKLREMWKEQFASTILVVA